MAGYPAMRIVALAETGTRGLLGAVIGGQGERAEVPLARKLVTLLGEVAYLALRHTLLGGYVLRSRDRAGAEQELWALLTVYQVIRMAMTAAAESAGADPDRASFTIALQAARDQVTAARGVADSADPADTGRIGRAVLDGLLPARRPRYSARKVKCSTSRYHVRDAERGQDRPCQSVTITRVQITIRVPPADRPAARPRRANQPPGPRPLCPGSRRDQVTRIMASQPGQDWSGAELASRLGVKPPNLLTQLAEWTRLGFLSKTGRGRYALPGPAAPDGTATDSAGP